MIRRLFWLAVFIGLALAGYHWLFQSGSMVRPQESPRGVMNAFCRAVAEGDYTDLARYCLPEAGEQIPEIRSELETRRQRGAPVNYAYVDGNTGPSGDHAQGLIWIVDTTGNRLPRWDVYVSRDDQRHWWIERFSDR